MQVISQVLAAIGRHGAIGFALSLFMGIGLPTLAAAARPLLPITIFCFMVVVFLRADVQIIGGLIRRPKTLVLSVTWLILAPAVMVWLVLQLIGRDALDPGMVLGLAVLGAAPPIMSSPAVAILYGFEPSLIIASVLTATLLSPIISPLLADVIAGQSVPLDASALMMRLAIFVVGGMVVAMILRRLIGRNNIVAMRAQLDGFGVVMYFAFAIAAMDGVASAMLNTPLRVAYFIAVAVCIAAAGLIFSMLCLVFLPKSDRFVLGYASGQRNMGLLIAALGAGVPDTTFLFFALAQFPIYLAPWILTPIARKLVRTEVRAPAE